MGIDQKHPLFAGKTDKRFTEFLRKEASLADRLAAHRLERRLMPESLRSQARAWGLETFMETVWSNGFQAGLREAVSEEAERKALKEAEDQ